MPIRLALPRPRTLAACAAALLLAACGGGGGEDGGSAPPNPPAPRAPIEARFSGATVLKLRANAGAVLALTEKPHAFMDVTVMERTLSALDGAGKVLYTWTPPSGWTLADFALHPSSQASVVLSDGARLRLARIDAAGKTLTTWELADPQVALDRYYGGPNSVRDRTALAPWKTRDGARLAPSGEALGLVIRAGGNNVVAYGIDYASGAFRQRWRTLVEPGAHLEALRPTTGSFDPFEGVENHWKVFMDVDAAGRMAVGVLASPRGDTVEAHAAWFGDGIPATLQHGVLLTTIDPGGQRLRTVPLDLGAKGELHAVKWAGDAVLLGGRVRLNRPDDPEGWDGWFARLDNGGQRLAHYRTIHVDRGDAILDLLPLSDGGVLLAGATGYTQNRTGESVSETSAPLLARLPAGEGAPTRLAVPSGPRGNQVRTVSFFGSNWLVANTENLPGTHTHDGNEALITADAVVRERTPAN
ncbi:hypothetical protein LQ564_17725 [Massilia sp. G4R7]|uniref:Lipoprotein n=1 Tax=Massilia phyllostachyos TaxID=2898585 RepID=A0ABS8Q8S5_9BURK|nr:hypothetical protein [Massilia phyllostachyos]MCD2518153.1 hypothetical protein [Massilia phyllostachyos]